MTASKARMQITEKFNSDLDCSYKPGQNKRKCYQNHAFSKVRFEGSQGFQGPPCSSMKNKSPVYRKTTVTFPLL